MSFAEKHIVALLEKAGMNHDRKALQQAMVYLRKLKLTPVLIDVGTRHLISDDSWLFACEAAVYLKEWETVVECLQQIQIASLTRKAYHVRALYCFAEYYSYLATDLRCAALTDKIQTAIAKVSKGIQIALGDPARLSHLVVHGYNLHWNVVRSLYRDGMFGELLPSITLMANALEKIDYKNWQVRVSSLLRVAVCLAGCGRAGEANNILTKASDLSQRQAPQMKLSIFRMQVALSKLVANPKLRQDAVKSYLRAILAVQNVYAGITEGNAALTELMTCYNELNAEVLLDKTAAMEIVSPQNKAAPKPSAKAVTEDMSANEETAMKEEMYTEIGCLLAWMNALDPANEVAKRAPSASTLRGRVMGEYVRGIIDVQQCGGIAIQNEGYFNPCTEAMIEEISNGLKKFEKALVSALRIQDVSDRIQVVQLGVVFMWKISQPLLQPTTRNHINKPFQTALRALDTLGSNMHMLRTLLALEIAYCDQDQFVVKAAAKVNYALSLDYVPSEEAVQLYTYDRPLDRFLAPMNHKFTLKLDIYGLPTNVEDEVLLLLEQAKEAAAAGNRTSLLNRALTTLLETDPPEDFFVDTDTGAGPTTTTTDKKAPAKGGKGVVEDKDKDVMVRDPEVEARRLTLRKRIGLFMSIIDLAWKDNSPALIPIVRQSVAAVTKRKWVRRADRDMQIAKIKAFLVFGETYIVELKSKGLVVGQRAFEDGTATEELEEETGEEKNPTAMNTAIRQQQAKAIAEKSRCVAEAHQQISNAITQATAIGITLVVTQKWDDRWTVLNAAISMFNWHRHLFDLNDFYPYTGTLETVYNALIQCNATTPRDLEILSNIANCFVRALIQKFIMSKVPNFTEADLIAVDIAKVKVSDPNSPILKQCVDTCEKMFQLLTAPMEARHFYTLLAAVRKLEGKPLDYRPHPHGKALMQLQASLSVEGKDLEALLLQCVEAVQQNPNVELIARLALRMRLLPSLDKATVRLCTQAQSLGEKGLLGSKDNPVAPQTTAKDAKAPPAGKGATTILTNTLTSPVEEKKHEPTKEDFYFLCVALQVKAECLCRTIDPSHAKDTQNEIRKICLMTLKSAAKAALRGRKDLATNCLLLTLHLFSQCCGEFAETPYGRSSTLPSISELLTPNVTKAIDETALFDPVHATTNARLFSLYLSCLRDGGDFEKGMTVLKQAFQALPLSHHNLLWESDIEFRCASGKNPTPSLQKVKEYGPPVQAKAWSTFSRCSSNQKDQLFGLVKAVEVLQEMPSLQAEYLLSLGSWLIRNGGTIQEIHDTLYSVTDVLSEFADLHGGEDGGGLEGTLSRKSSLRSSRAGSQAGSHHSLNSKKSEGNKKNEMTLTLVHLATIVHSYSLLAVTTCDGMDRSNVVLSGHHYVMRIWTMLQTSVNSYLKKLKLKLSQFGDTQQANKGAKVQISLSAEMEQLMKADLTPLTLPTYAVGWVGFEVSEAISSHLQNIRNGTSITTLPNPVEFISVLNMLSAELTTLGYDTLAIPVDQLSVIVARTMSQKIESNNLVAIANSRIASRLASADNSVLATICNEHIRFGVSDIEKASLRENAKMILTNENEQTTITDCVATNTNVLCDMWITEANWLLSQGKVSAARMLLLDAIFDAEAHKNELGKKRCEAYWATISRLEGKKIEAVTILPGASIDAYVQVQLENFLEKLDALEMLKCEEIFDLASRALRKQSTFLENKELQGPVNRMCQQGLYALYDGCVTAICNKILSTPFIERYTAIDKWAVVWSDFGIELGDWIGSSNMLLSSGLMYLRFSILHAKNNVLLSSNSTTTANTKRALFEEFVLLEQAYERTKEVMKFVGRVPLGPRESDNIAYSSRIQSMFAHLNYLKGVSILRTSSANLKLLYEEWAGSVHQAPNYPVVSGKDSGYVKKFMVSTARERRAVTNYYKYQKEHEAREVRRAEIRVEWEAQRKAMEEQLAAAAAAAPTKPGKPDPKAGKKKMSLTGEAPPLMPLEPDCGIESPPQSGTESDEDSQDEDEDTYATVLRGICPKESFSLATITPLDAVSFFNSTISNVPPHTYLHQCAVVGLAWSHRCLLENKNTFHEKWVEHVREVAVVTWLDSLWSKPVEVPIIIEEDTTGKAAAKKPPPKEDPKKGGAPAPLPPPTPQEPKRAFQHGTGAQIDHAKLAITSLEDVIDKLNGVFDFATVERCAMELAHLYLMTSQRALCGRYIAIAQCMRVAEFVTNLWMTAVHSDVKEACVWRLAQHMRSQCPGLVGSPTFHNILKALQSGSPVFRRVALQKLLNSAGDPFFGANPQPTDVVYWTLHADVNDMQLYSVFFRAGAVPDVRRAPLPLKDIQWIRMMLGKASAETKTLLSVDYSDQSQENDKIDNLSKKYESTLMSTLDNAFGGLLNPLSPLLAKLTNRPQLVLCLDPILADIPIELHPVIASGTFKSVTRELSLHTATTKVTHIKTFGEKLNVANIAYTIDVFNETKGSIYSALSEGRATGTGKDTKLPWPGLTGSDPAAPVPPSASQFQRILTAPTTSFFLYCSTGKIGGCYDIASLAGLNLDNVKHVVILDNGVNGQSVRREATQDVTKSSRKLWLESGPWIPILMLARGVGVVVAQTFPVRPRTNETLMKMSLNTCGKNPLEMIHTHIRLRGNGQDADTYKVWGMNFLEQTSLMTWGLIAEDAAAPSGKK